MNLLTPDNLESARQSFISILEQKRPQGSLRNKITVVFDGRSNTWSDVTSPYVKIIFSSNETADDKIKRMVANASNPKNIIVVTNDRAIQYAVRASNAKVMMVDAFLKKLSNDQKGKKVSPSKEGLSRMQQQKINSELEQVWLKPKGDQGG